ncbi:Smr/MutS family protein [Nonlabens xiamenensis]|uniref:Smr/MutS family protein n=1 Tax=Nonlabens xiamenensis TaxID=2341043 RepID=UPI000F609A1B|nr:Smr/MutS family protein [Nonlabens xiamenensis]
MQQFKKGDRVLVVDEDLAGVVAFAKAESITIRTEEGLELLFNVSELIHDRSFEIKHVEVKPETVAKKSLSRSQSKKRAAQIHAVEIDLHIHQLVKNEKGMDAYDKLNLQIDTARHRLEWAIRERVPKLVFIHGVGQGVLRQELEFLLDRYSEVTYYDADFQKYGRGATEVYIYQSKIN